MESDEKLKKELQKENKDKDFDIKKKKEMILQKCKEIEQNIKNEIELKLYKELKEKLEKEMKIKLNKELKYNQDLNKNSKKQNYLKFYIELKDKYEIEMLEKLLNEFEEKSKNRIEETNNIESEKQIKNKNININQENEENNINIDNNNSNYDKNDIINGLNNDNILRDDINNDKNKSENEIKNILKNGIKNNKIINKDNMSIEKLKNKYNIPIKNIELDDIIKNADLFFSNHKNNSYEKIYQKIKYVYAIDKYIENEINMNKDNNLMTPDEAIYYIENNIIRFLGYFGSELIFRKITTFIEKTVTNQILREICFKILTSGLATQKVYQLVFEDEEIKIMINKNNNIWPQLIEILKTKIINLYSLSENDIYFFSPNIDNYEINLIIFNKTVEDLEKFLKPEKITTSINLLLNHIILSPCIFEQNFCKLENKWPKKNLFRGGKKYYPPYGYNGISLKILNNNNTHKNMIWLGKQNIDGEWPVAYHPIGNGKIFDRILNILNGDLKEEEIKLYKKDKNTEDNKDKYPLCGEGLYCCPEIIDTEKYATKTSLGLYNIKFQFVLMMRVNPDKIRNPGGFPVCWILSGNDEEIRPYRLLFKICTD